MVHIPLLYKSKNIIIILSFTMHTDISQALVSDIIEPFFLWLHYHLLTLDTLMGPLQSNHHGCSSGSPHHLLSGSTTKTGNGVSEVQLRRSSPVVFP